MPTSNFSPNDPTKVTLVGRWTYDGTRILFNSHGSEMRFSFTGTDLQLNYNCGSAGVGIDISIDGGSYTGITLAATGGTKTIVTAATGLSDTVHTAAIRLNNSYTGGTVKIYLADGIVVTGAAPAIAAFPNHDTTGRQHLVHSDSRLVNNFAIQRSDLLIGFSSPSLPLTSAASHGNGKQRFKTDGATLWVLSYAGGLRCYVDGFANEEKTYTIPAGTSTPSIGWHSFSLPNDGQMHDICVVGTRSIDMINVAGGTGIFESDLARGLKQCRVAFVGDSVTAGDSAVPYTNSSAGLDVLAELALPGRFTAYNRGLSGDTITAWNSNGRARTDLLAIQPDVVVCFMGINDMTGLTTTGARDAKRDEYIIAYREMLKACPKAAVYQFQINPDHRPATPTNYDYLKDAQQAAITSVAAEYPGRTIQFIAADASWTYGPGSPTTGFTRLGAHPLPSGNCYGMGKNHASIVLSAQPSGGDSITATIGGTSYTFTFNAGAHGASPNPVTIGADVGATITNLKNVMLTVLGRANMVAWTNGSSEGYFVGVRNCSAISKSGTNVFAYRLSVPGFADMLDPLVPAAPTTGGSVFIPRGMKGGYAS